MIASALQVMSAIAEFKLLPHEILEITNIVNHIDGNKSIGHLETSIQHSLCGGKRVECHKNIVWLFHVVNGKSDGFDNIHDIQPPINKLYDKSGRRQRIWKENIKCALNHRNSLFRLEMSNILEEAKILLQKYLR